MYHIQCVVTNECSRVGYLIENVSGEFTNIMAAMASIILDDTSTGMRNDFDKAVAYLLPIAEGNKKDPNKDAHGRISKLIATVSAPKAYKVLRGPSGVEYCFHSIPEYNNLGEEERRDIHKWRRYNPEFFSKEGKQVSPEKGKRRFKGSMPYKPDSPKTRPDSKKENQACCSEIASVLQEKFALCDEKERDYTKFKSLIYGHYINVDKEKPASISSEIGTVQDHRYELGVLYAKMNAGRT